MIFASDEVGGFDVGHSGYDPSFWVTLVCPPATAATLRRQVDFWTTEWQLEELHARDLTSSQRLTIAHFLAGTDAFWMAAGIDRELMSADEVRQWRVDQAKIAREAYEASTQGDSIHARYRGRGELIQRLLLDQRRVPLAPFVQFGIVAPGHMQMVVQAALRRYADFSYRHAWQTREWLIDGKGAGRHGGPKLFEEILLPCLAGRTLHLPVSLRARDHPIAELIHAADGGLGVLDLLSGMPTFVDDSSSEPLIQVADLIGWAIRRRITHPAEETTRDLYGTLLRGCRRTDDGRPVHLMYRSTRSTPPDDRRYRPLLHG
ncbi:MAG TPA: DUF3800 domain-containing protein [Solirubrobacteraceae bacterium]|jgi:hypothetical protein